MKKVILKIDGMTCSACSNGLEKYLNAQKGVEATVNLVLAQAFCYYDDHVTIEDLERFVKEAGFVSLGVYDGKEEHKKVKRYPYVLFGLLSILLLYISMGHMVGLPSIPYLSPHDNPLYYAICLYALTIPYLFFAKDIFANGIKNLIHRTPNMDTLVMVGCLSSFIYSLYHFVLILLGIDVMMAVESLYFESTAMVLYFVKLGRFFDGRSKEKTKEAIKELVSFTPAEATLKEGNRERKVTLDEIHVGDVLICKPGEKVAVDGTILKGTVHLNEAFITGESRPSKKSVGDSVVAGSMNLDGYIEYQAEKIGKDSTISEIVRLVVEASNTKAKIQKIADKVSSYFVPFIFVLAFLTLGGYLLLKMPINEAVTSFVNVLVVACPCALGLATPLAMMVSIGACAKHGILVKNNETLEKGSKIDTVVFDKTGTLTYGELRIKKVYTEDSTTQEELLNLVIPLEEKSTHPIASAFLKYKETHEIPEKEVQNFQNKEGMGIVGEIEGSHVFIGNEKLLREFHIKVLKTEKIKKREEEGATVIYVARDQEFLGSIVLQDAIRENAKDVISELKRMGKEVLLLTGDNKGAAVAVAKNVGIETVISSVIPKQKLKVLEDILENKKVMMVGDGINDAPSLAKATIGVSISGATDIATDSADVILLHDDLDKLIDFFNASKRTMRNIKQNLFWAFFYNLCMIPIAIGCLKPWGISFNPMIAGLAMTLSSLTVVMNALRLKRWKRRKKKKERVEKKK